MWIFASTVVTFLAMEADRLGLGLVLSLEELGLYSVALIFARLALPIAESLTASSLFPALSRKQDDPEGLMAACLRAREVILLASGAVSIAILLWSPLFFETLYDARYHAAGEIARWLVIFAWMNLLNAGVNRVALARGVPRISFIANLIQAFGLGAGFVGYELFGLPGFICGMAVLAFAAHVYVVWTLPARRAAVVRQSLMHTLGFGAYGVGCLLAVQSVGPGQVGRWLMLVGLGLAPLAASAMGVFRLMRGHVKDDGR